MEQEEKYEDGNIRYGSVERCTCSIKMVEVEQEGKWYGADVRRREVLMLVLGEMASKTKVKVPPLFH